jgi:hypothetical protein
LSRCLEVGAFRDDSRQPFLNCRYAAYAIARNVTLDAQTMKRGSAVPRRATAFDARKLSH